MSLRVLILPEQSGFFDLMPSRTTRSFFLMKETGLSLSILLSSIKSVDLMPSLQRAL